MSSRTCGVSACRGKILSFDPHPLCISHRECSPSNPCQAYCIGLSAEHRAELLKSNSGKRRKSNIKPGVKHTSSTVTKSTTGPPGGGTRSTQGTGAAIGLPGSKRPVSAPPQLSNFGSDGSVGKTVDACVGKPTNTSRHSVSTVTSTGAAPVEALREHNTSVLSSTLVDEVEKVPVSSSGPITCVTGSRVDETIVSEVPSSETTNLTSSVSSEAASGGTTLVELGMMSRTSFPARTLSLSVTVAGAAPTTVTSVLAGSVATPGSVNIPSSTSSVPIVHENNGVDGTSGAGRNPLDITDQSLLNGSSTGSQSIETASSIYAGGPVGSSQAGFNTQINSDGVAHREQAGLPPFYAQQLAPHQMWQQQGAFGGMTGLPMPIAQPWLQHQGFWYPPSGAIPFMGNQSAGYSQMAQPVVYGSQAPFQQPLQQFSTIPASDGGVMAGPAGYTPSGSHPSSSSRSASTWPDRPVVVDMDISDEDVASSSDQATDGGSDDDDAGESDSDASSDSDSSNGSDQEASLPPLPAEVLVHDFPADTQSILTQVAKDLGLSTDEESAGGQQSIFSAASCASDSSVVRPLLKFPPDTRNDWTAAGTSKSSGYSNVFKVTEQDFNSVLRVPVVDPDVLKRLPTSTGKSEPASFSPYWEDSLRSLDHTTRSIVRLGVFGSTIAEHLARVIAKDDRPSSPQVREARVLANILKHSTNTAMGVAHRLIAFRQSNVIAFMKATYGHAFADDLRGVLKAEEFLFGNKFAEKVESRANAVSHEKTLTEAESKLKKSKKRAKKSKKSSGASSGSSATKTSAQRDQPSTSYASSSKKGQKRRGGTSASSTGPKSKRSKGSGKGQKS